MDLIKDGERRGKGTLFTDLERNLYSILKLFLERQFCLTELAGVRAP